MRSEVQLLLGPPLQNMVGGLSSAGRAPALQAGGHRFDPDRLHQFNISPEVKTTVPVQSNLVRFAGFARFFDIVNGFFNRCRDVAAPIFQGIGDTCVAKSG